MQKLLLAGAAGILLVACQLPMTAELNNPADANAPGYNSTKSKTVYVYIPTQVGIDTYKLDQATGELTSTAAAFSTFSTVGAYPMVADPNGGRVLMAVDNANSQIYVYDIGSDGALSDQDGFPTEAGGAPETTHGGAVFSPSGKFVYVVTDTVLKRWPINSAGHLGTLVPQSLSMSGMRQMLITPDGKYAYILKDGSTYGISPFSVDASTGALTALSGTISGSGTQPRTMVMDSNGKAIVVTGGSDPDFELFGAAISSADGTLTSMTPTMAAQTAVMSSFDPLGRFVYVLDNTGAPTKAYGNKLLSTPAFGQATNSPFFMAGGGSATLVAFDAAGKYAFFSNSFSGSNVIAYAIDDSTGELGNGQIHASMGGYFVVDPSGKWGIGIDTSYGPKTYHIVSNVTMPNVSSLTSSHIVQGLPVFAVVE